MIDVIEMHLSVQRNLIHRFSPSKDEIPQQHINGNVVLDDYLVCFHRLLQISGIIAEGDHWDSSPK